MSRFFEIPISSVNQQTVDAVDVSFDIPEELSAIFRFQPGQYLTVDLDIDGVTARRSYSICSSINEEQISIGVKRVEGGLVSSVINDQWQPGDLIRVMAPEGRFTSQLGGKHHYLLLASGSGITPCLSIAKSVLENEPDSKITLIYGNRSVQTMMFRDTLSILKDKYMGRLLVTNLMSREAQDVEIFNGRLDAVKVSELISAGIIEAELYDTAYICGPQEMIEGARDALEGVGMSSDSIKFELFGTDFKPRDNAKAENAVNGAFVDIIFDGNQKRVPIDGTKQTILTAAQQAGLDLPFSCAGGMCCTCRCKIIDGEAEMDVNYSLEKWEIDAGFTLACQARPKSKSIILDFDAI